MAEVIEPSRVLSVLVEGDVVVVGGGPAGLGAAVRAARNGAKTVLVELFGNLGGFNTTGFMFAAIEGDHLAAEIFDILRPEGYVVDLLDTYPQISTNPLTHYWYSHDSWSPDNLFVFDPDMCSYVMNRFVQEAGVTVLFRSHFVDVVLDDNSISAIIIESPSGRQAITAKVFIDATGRGDLIARSGVPFASGKNEHGYPMPMGLMWKMAGVNIEELFEYQKQDPKLDALIQQAKKNGDLKRYRDKNTELERKMQDVIYTGHPGPEMTPALYPGEILFWMPSVHGWGLDGAQSVRDITRAEVDIREQIMEEVDFLRKYVPGFNNSHLSGIAPYIGVREGRHPDGEYMITSKDIKSAKEFEDLVLKLKANDMKDPSLTGVQYGIPYRCFLPKRVDNLLVTGDCICATHDGFLHVRGFGKAMNLGEVTGIAASVSIQNNVGVKDIDYSLLEQQLRKIGIL